LLAILLLSSALALIGDARIPSEVANKIVQLYERVIVAPWFHEAKDKCKLLCDYGECHSRLLASCSLLAIASVTAGVI
jgi:hypothetical protein